MVVRQTENTKICWDEKRKVTQPKPTIHIEEINQKVLMK